jgi:hypothetical protein
MIHQPILTILIGDRGVNAADWNISATFPITVCDLVLR